MRPLPTIPCDSCGDPTPYVGTRLCDPCWEVDRRLDKVPAVLIRRGRHDLHRTLGLFDQFFKTIVTPTNQEDVDGS